MTAPPVLLKKFSPQLLPCEVHFVPLEWFICSRGGSWMESSLLNSAFKCTQSWSRVPIQSQTQFSMAMGKNLQLFQSTQVRKPNPDSDAALLSHKWVNTQRPLCSLQWTSFTLSRYFWLSSDFRMWFYVKISERIISILIQIPAASQFSTSLKSAWEIQTWCCSSPLLMTTLWKTLASPSPPCLSNTINTECFDSISSELWKQSLLETP